MTVDGRLDGVRADFLRRCAVRRRSPLWIGSHFCLWAACLCTAIGPLDAAHGAEKRQQPKKDKETAIEYDWQEKYEYECDFELALVAFGQKEKYSGSTTLHPQPSGLGQLNRIDALLDNVEHEHVEASGTAFAVTADGVMVTCAHVVRGATEITAHFRGKQYLAQVVLFDSDHDLALLKIKTQGSPHLPLADSDKVQLAEEIRVIGYPLSDVLGESIKITRGTISGIIQREGGENRFQIDANINPGNSGGPLVDARGRVVGIASELLTSDRIDSVGFAIPSNEARSLLTRKGIAVASPPDGPALEGTELAKKVTPAVAFLKVKTGPEGVGVRPKTTFMFTGLFGRQTDGTSLYGRYGDTQSGHVVIDSCGEIIATDCKEALPGVFQTLCEVGVEHLPGDGRFEWRHSRAVTLETTQSAPSRDSAVPGPLPHYWPRYGPRYRLPPRGPSYPRMFGPSEPVVTQTVPAREETYYRRVSDRPGGLVKVVKKYTFRSAAKGEGAQPAIDLQMEGSFLWNPEVACVRTSEMKGSLVLNREGVTVRVPLAMTYKCERKPGIRKEDLEAAKKRMMAEIERSRARSRERAAGDSNRTSRGSARRADSGQTPRNRGSLSIPPSQGLSKFRPND